MIGASFKNEHIDLGILCQPRCYSQAGSASTNDNVVIFLEQAFGGRGILHSRLMLFGVCHFDDHDGSVIISERIYRSSRQVKCIS